MPHIIVAHVEHVPEMAWDLYISYFVYPFMFSKLSVSSASPVCVAYKKHDPGLGVHAISGRCPFVSTLKVPMALSL